MSLCKLNSVSGRNNRLKCLEFSNPVDCNYVKQDKLRGKTFFADHCDFGFKWGKFVAAEK